VRKLTIKRNYLKRLYIGCCEREEEESWSRGPRTLLVLDHGSTWGHMGVLPFLLSPSFEGFR
jgi:hypothetical protein